MPGRWRPISDHLFVFIEDRNVDRKWAKLGEFLICLDLGLVTFTSSGCGWVQEDCLFNYARQRRVLVNLNWGLH